LYFKSWVPWHSIKIKKEDPQSFIAVGTRTRVRGKSGSRLALVRKLNKIIVIGHLGRDPEMKYTPDGKAVTTFSVASSRKYTGFGRRYPLMTAAR